MWSRFASMSLPVLQRSTCALSGPALRAAPRAQEAAGGLRWTLPSVQVCGQHTASAPSSRQAVRHAQALQKERMVQVDWEDGGHSLYPFTWLRDNCQCPMCMLDSAQARKLLMTQVDVNTGIDSVDVTRDSKVSIVWPDKHTSVFDPAWLKRRCFSPAAREALQEELFYNERYYWDSKLRIPTLDFEQVLRDDQAALEWLMALRRVGLVQLKGAPLEKGQVVRLAQRVGYLRLTFYGTTFQVEDKQMANNVAYTTGTLSAHTDYPAMNSPPGVQVLHCITQAAEGGESVMVDGFRVAQQLRAEDPESFDTLTKLRIDFTDIGTDYCDFSLQSKKRIIEVDDDGRLAKVHLNNATRDTVLDVPLEQVQPFYKALRAITDIGNRPENALIFKMDPGDVVIFDNWRVLHGRQSYLSRPGMLRHLEGCYLDWDEVMSRLRILQGSVRTDA